MNLSSLIIHDNLLDPPFDSLAFRTVTMFSHDNFKLSVLIQTEQETKDLFYKYLQRKGLMDYIDYILNQNEYEDRAIHLDHSYSFPCTIVIKSILLDNQLSILGKINSYLNKV